MAAANEKIYKLKSPFEYEGKSYEELRLDFGALKGRDVIAVEDELTEDGKGFFIAPELSTPFVIRLAARAAGIPYEAFSARLYPDFMKVRALTRNFMLAGGSVTELLKEV